MMFCLSMVREGCEVIVIAIHHVADGGIGDMTMVMKWGYLPHGQAPFPPPACRISAGDGEKLNGWDGEKLTDTNI